MAKKQANTPKKDDFQLGLFKEVLSVIFNIHPKQVQRIMDVLTRSEDILNIKTRLVMDHAGPRAVNLIRKAVEYARHEGSSKHETSDDDYEMTKRSDISDILALRNQGSSIQRPEDNEDNDVKNEKPIHECTFKDYLMELMVSDDKQQAMRDIQLAAKNPEGYNKLQTKEVIDKKKEIAAEPPENKLKADEMRINDSERKLLVQKKLLADKQKRQEEQNPSLKGDTGERPAAGMVP